MSLTKSRATSGGISISVSFNAGLPRERLRLGEREAKTPADGTAGVTGVDGSRLEAVRRY
jgi:hypothetical protein